MSMAQQIEAKTQALEEKTQKKGIKEERIRKLRARWLPALQQLVDNISEKFSAAFDRASWSFRTPYWTFSDWLALQVLAVRERSASDSILTTMTSGASRSWSSSAIQNNFVS